MLLITVRFLLSSFVLFFAVCAATEYDYIVIGAGSAGSIVASNLASSSGRNTKVLLLEAGGDDSDPVVKNMFAYYYITKPGYYLNYGYQTTGQDTIGGSGSGVPSKTFDIPRGKVLGGSHSINAAAYVKGHKDDFNKIAQTLGDRDWSWNAMQPFYGDVERTLEIVEYAQEQVGAPAYIASAQSILNFTFNPNCGLGNQNGVCTSLWTGENGGIRSTSFNGFVRPLIADGKLDVITFHRVDKLLFDPSDSSKVIGVRASNLRSETSVEFSATKEVILSAGTYNSPKILMLSGVGPAAALSALGITVVHDVQGVGQNLRDHYSTAVFWDRASLPESTPFLFQSPVMNLFGPEKTGQTKYQFEISGTYGSVVPLRASSVGTVTLASSDPADDPLIDPNVASSAGDLQALADGLKYYLLPFFGDLVKKGWIKPAQGGLAVSASDADINAWILEPGNLFSSHHPVGTCKVGISSDNTSVVDNNFLVKGTANLRVIDASVFPLAPSGNINAPTMALAGLGAHKVLKQKRGRGKEKQALRV